MTTRSVTIDAETGENLELFGFAVLGIRAGRQRNAVKPSCERN